MPTAIVVGGGLGGLAAALALEQAGWQVEVFERAETFDHEAGSISLWSNGMAALEALGVRPSRAQVVDKMELGDGAGRRLLDVDLARIARTYGRDNVGVWRQDLLDDLAASRSGKVHLAKSCIRVENRPRSAVAYFEDGATAEADLVVGADGVGSAVRTALWGGGARHGGTTCWEGRVRRVVAEHLDPSVVLAVADGATFGAIFPFADGRLHWFIDRPERMADQVHPTPAAVLAACRDWPAPFPSVVGATAAEELHQTPIYLRRPPRRWWQGRVVLVGDAAHGMGPALGQGASQAFIDAVLLGRALSNHRRLEVGLRSYQLRRSAPSRGLWLGSTSTLRLRRTGVFPRIVSAMPGTVGQAAFRMSAKPTRAAKLR